MVKIFKALALSSLYSLALLAASLPLVYLRPNETPMFTELYRYYGLLNPPALHVYDSSIYLGQPGEKGLLIPSSEAFFNDVEQSLRTYHKRLGTLEIIF